MSNKETFHLKIPIEHKHFFDSFKFNSNFISYKADLVISQLELELNYSLRKILSSLSEEELIFLSSISDTNNFKKDLLVKPYLGLKWESYLNKHINEEPKINNLNLLDYLNTLTEFEAFALIYKLAEITNKGDKH